MKIIKKAFIYVVVVGVLIVIFNSIVPNPYTSQRNDMMDIIENPSKYKSFAFGRSHAASLDYDYYAISGYNFALGGRDLASVDYLLHYLIPRCDSLKEVLLFISYTSLYFDNTAISAGNLNDARKELYYTTPACYPIDLADFNNFVFGKALIFIQPDAGQSLLKKYFWGKGNEEEDIKSESLILSEEEMILSGINKARRDVLDKQSALLYDKKIVESNSVILKDIIEFCQQKQIKIYLIQAPYYHTYNEKVPAVIIREVDEVISCLSLEYHVPYFDFSKDTAFVRNKSLFMDSDHLNSLGKKKFTEILNKVIK